MSEQNDKAPFVSSEMPNYQRPEGDARQHFPGSNANQFRPSMIKRDSDVPGPIMEAMGGISYCYAPPANKKKGY